MTYPKRLIEVDLPIARISAHARREKSIRHGHISTLHIWWARRPLAACRAVICAALWPDPADELCPLAFREAAVAALAAFAKRVFPDRLTEESRQLQETLSPEGRERWEAISTSSPPPLTGGGRGEGVANHLELRAALLDFIADFANWDNSTVPAYLETSRALTQSAHEALGGAPGTRPLVVDPFAGGGSIPLEALRVGADAFASDLNPVAVLLNKIVLEYIPKYGHKLADEVRKWGQWVKEQAGKELAEFYPKDPDGATPIAYLWSRTILSEAPADGEIPVEVPLLRSLWLCKKPNRKFAFRWVRDKSGQVQTKTETVASSDGATRQVRRPQLEIFRPVRDSEVEGGTVARGAATCPVTKFTTPAKNVRAQLKQRHGGSADGRLNAVVTVPTSGQGRDYRIANSCDADSALRVCTNLSANGHSVGSGDLAGVPTPPGKGKGAGRAFSQRIYGMDSLIDLYTPRQRLVMETLARTISCLPTTDLSDAIRTMLACALGRVNDQAMTLCRWRTTVEAIAAANGGQNKMPVIPDFVEANTFGDRGGDWMGQLEWVAKVIDHCAASLPGCGSVVRGAAQRSPLPDDSSEILFTDPPYYDAFPYSDLSDFFLHWFRQVVPAAVLQYPTDISPKDEEIVVYDVIHGNDGRVKDQEYFSAQMTESFIAARDVVKPTGIAVVVFANKTTAGWEALIESLIKAGWVATASWPIDTEKPGRQRAQGSAALASSVHVVCRPRQIADGSSSESVGEWRDVLNELPKRIHEWMPRLAAEGVVGADAIFACLGPALEIYSRYDRVEKSNGETATLREFLEQVWGAVATEALSLIFKDADAAGLEPDARLTAMWLWTTGGVANGNGNGMNAPSPRPPPAKGEGENGEPAPAMGDGEDSEADAGDEASESDGDGESTASAGKSKAVAGFTLEFDAARKIAQGLGVDLEQSDSLVEIKGDKVRLLSVVERTAHLFGKGAAAGRSAGGRRAKAKQKTFFAELDEAEAAEAGWSELKGPTAGSTALDRVHQAMILFGAGRGELLKRFLVEDGVGRDNRFWKLADNLNKLYPRGTDERRWIEGLLARKKGLGL